MKKSKLLMPLVGVAALGATVAAPIATLTSCSQDSVESISAKYTLGTNTFIHATINKSDIVVTATMKSGKTQEIKDWTCDKFTGETYVVAEDDVTEGKLTLVIKYKGKETSIVLDIETIANLTFDNPVMQLVKTTDFTTQKKFNLYTYGGLPQKISPKHLKFESSSELLKVECIDQTKDIWTVAASDVFTSGTAEATLAVFDEGSSNAEPLATATVHITDSSIASIDATETEASITIKKGLDMVSAKQTKLNGVFMTPDYVKVGNKTLPVTSFTKPEEGEMTNIRSVVIPDTITYIPANLFAANQANAIALQNIIYYGTIEQWNAIDARNNWMGEVATKAFCVADGEYVEFGGNKIGCSMNEAGTELVSDSKLGALIPQTYIVNIDLTKVPTETLKKYLWTGLSDSALLTVIPPTINRIFVDFNGEKFEIRQSESLTWNPEYKAYTSDVLSKTVAEAANAVLNGLTAMVAVEIYVPGGSTNVYQTHINFEKA